MCSNYNDVDTRKKLVRATEGASSVIVAINYGQLAVDAGLAKPNTDPAVSDKYVAADGVTYPVKVTITMKEAGAYYDEWDARQLPQRTGDRNADMYKNLTDAEFANVRVIETTGMGEGVLYRGSSPSTTPLRAATPMPTPPPRLRASRPSSTSPTPRPPRKPIPAGKAATTPRRTPSF